MYELPLWVVPNSRPGFYDTESATVIEQTAKVYKAMQDLITEYNTFAGNVNTKIAEFMNGTAKDYEVFTTELRQEFQDFIDTIELQFKNQNLNISESIKTLNENYYSFTNSINTKMNVHDNTIADAVKYMKTNLGEFVYQVIIEMRNSGELTDEIMRAFDDIVQRLNTETENRTEGDNTLRQLIEEESNRRKNDTDSIRNELSSETEIRKTKCENLEQSINQEVTQRKLAVESLQQSFLAKTMSLENEIDLERAHRSLAISSEALQRENDVASLNERINAFTSLPEGSTTGDAELIDARVDHLGNQYTNAGSHIRAIGEATDSLALLSKPFLNINIEDYSKKQIFELLAGEKTSGKFMTNEPMVYDSYLWNYYTFDVEPCENLYIRATTNNAGKCVIFFDSNDNMVGFYPSELYADTTSLEFEIVVPYNAEKMIVNEQIDHPAVEVKRVSSIDFNKTGCRFVKSIEDEFHNMEIEGCTKEKVYEDVKNQGIQRAGAFYGSDNVVYDTAMWNYYEFDVKNDEKYFIEGWTVSLGVLFLFLDDENNIISCFPSEASGGEVLSIETDVPSNAVKMIVNEMVDIGLSIGKYKSIKFSAPIQPSFLSGKSLVACGDSITEGINPEGGFFKNYAELTAERNGMIYHNCGVSGSTMSNVEGHNPFSESRYLNLPEFDYLTIWFGWNDEAYANIGTIDDEVDTTFYGAYKKVLSHLITTYPTKKIGLIVPYLYGNGATQQAVRDIGNLYGVPYLDLYDSKHCTKFWGWETPTEIARKNAFTYDGTHPNQEGYNFLSTMYEHFIKSL